MSPIFKKKSFWVVMASFVVLAWVAQNAYRTLADSQESEQYRTLQEGDEMPANMPFLSLEGKFTNYGDYRGKVLLINFWAAWCAPCLKEMPSIYSLQKSLKERGLEVIGVAMDENLDHGMATLTRLAGAPPFLMVKGMEQAIANRFPMDGLPFTVIVDRLGKIRYAKPGERNWSDKDALALIEGMM